MSIYSDAVGRVNSSDAVAYLIAIININSLVLCYLGAYQHWEAKMVVLAATPLHRGVLLNLAMMLMVDREDRGEGAEPPPLPATPERRYVYI